MLIIVFGRTLTQSGFKFNIVNTHRHKTFGIRSYLAVIIWEDRPGALENVVFFIAVYAVFTALEVGFLWRQITR